MKVGLYGGAFNPIHRCHLFVAEQVRSRLGLDKVLFIPTGDPPHKPASEFIPATHRIEMIRLAIASYPHFEVSDIETMRPAKSYSIETVHELKQVCPPDTDFVFILGLDAFLDLPTWKAPEELVTACDFAVVSRPGSHFVALAKLPFFESTDADILQRMDEGKVALAKLPLKSGRTLWALAIAPCEVSAQEIRRRLQSGEDLENSLPAPVQSYILRTIRMGGG
jgi:nicotinate-nucleotide adenylyltransferase